VVGKRFDEPREFNVSAEKILKAVRVFQQQEYLRILKH